MKQKIILVCICLLALLSGMSCKSAEPIISSGSAEEIEKNLGFVLAPAYMTEGYEYGSLKDVVTQAEANGQPPVYLFYQNVVSLEETAVVMMEYPIEDTEASSGFTEQFGLVRPDDASTEIEINGMTAIVAHGGWTDETKERVSKLEFPIEPEWDYEYGISLTFYVKVRENENVQVRLTTSFPLSNSDLSEAEMIKIAKSVRVIE